jgi:hypothetical protein
MPLAAGGADFLGHGLGRAGRADIAAAFAAAQIVDQHLGALARGDQRRLASDAVAAAGDQHHLAVQNAHRRLLRCRLCPGGPAQLASRPRKPGDVRIDKADATSG